MFDSRHPLRRRDVASVVSIFVDCADAGCGGRAVHRTVDELDWVHAKADTLVDDDAVTKNGLLRLPEAIAGLEAGLASLQGDLATVAV